MPRGVRRAHAATVQSPPLEVADVVVGDPHRAGGGGSGLVGSDQLVFCTGLYRRRDDRVAFVSFVALGRDRQRRGRGVVGEPHRVHLLRGGRHHVVRLGHQDVHGERVDVIKFAAIDQVGRQGEHRISSLGHGTVARDRDCGDAESDQYRVGPLARPQSASGTYADGSVSMKANECAPEEILLTCSRDVQYPVSQLTEIDLVPDGIRVGPRERRRGPGQIDIGMGVGYDKVGRGVGHVVAFGDLHRGRGGIAEHVVRVGLDRHGEVAVAGCDKVPGCRDRMRRRRGAQGEAHRLVAQTLGLHVGQLSWLLSWMIFRHQHAHVERPRRRQHGTVGRQGEFRRSLPFGYVAPADDSDRGGVDPNANGSRRSLTVRVNGSDF